MLNNKADVLFLIMGTNPFPNIISVITRLKKGGEVFCICTEETCKKPYERFKKLIENKDITKKLIRLKLKINTIENQ